MGLLVAVAYAAIALALLAAGRALFVAESMDGVPFYDPADAEDPAALARVLGVSLVAFSLSTFAFAAFEAVERTTTIVVAAYTTLVLTVALLTATQTRKYE